MKGSNFIKALGLLSLPLAFTPAQAVEFGVFSDIGFESNKNTNQFALGDIDFYANVQLSDTTSAFLEYVFEEAGAATDVERIQINYNWNEDNVVGLGRYHAPLGYWSRNYHHGKLIQPTASRPSFLDFEDGDAAVMPMHVVGLLASGNINDLAYVAYVGNSSIVNKAAKELVVPVVSDATKDKMIGGRLTYSMEDAGLNLGFSALNSPVNDTTGANVATQTVYGFDVKYDNGPFGVLAEYYSIDNSDDTGGTQDGTASAYYAQFSYMREDNCTLVYRYEDLSIDDLGADAYFNALGKADDGGAHVLGMKHDLDDTNSLFLEVKRTEPTLGTSDTIYTVNWSFIMI